MPGAGRLQNPHGLIWALSCWFACLGPNQVDNLVALTDALWFRSTRGPWGLGHGRCFPGSSLTCRERIQASRDRLQLHLPPDHFLNHNGASKGIWSFDRLSTACPLLRSSEAVPNLSGSGCSVLGTRQWPARLGVGIPRADRPSTTRNGASGGRHRQRGRLTGAASGGRVQCSPR